MKRILCLTLVFALYLQTPARAGLLDDLTKEVLSPATDTGSSLDNSTIVSGLKEALATGTKRAVTEVSKTDGYFGNQLIKILLPDKVQKAAELLGKFGYQQQVDEFVLSMNRAAEKAAPKAADYFADAIRQMTLEDAKGILNGGDTAATQFFEKKTRPQLFKDFKPTVASTMDQVGTARYYKEMMASYQAIPLASMAGVPSLDLDTYVTDKALDGLFKMVATEEKNIRTNPVARTTDLLKKVFGGK